MVLMWTPLCFQMAFKALMVCRGDNFVMMDLKSSKQKLVDRLRINNKESMRCSNWSYRQVEV